MLDIWIEQTERAKFWAKGFNEPRSRRVNDILIAVVDAFKGLERDHDGVSADEPSKPASCI